MTALAEDDIINDEEDEKVNRLKRRFTPLLKRSSNESRRGVPKDQGTSHTASDPKQPSPPNLLQPEEEPEEEEIKDQSEDANDDTEREVPEEYLDLVQLASILLIPTLLRTVRDADTPSVRKENGKEDSNDNTGSLGIHVPVQDAGQSYQVHSTTSAQGLEFRRSPNIFRDVLRFIIIWLSEVDQEAAALNIDDKNFEIVLTERRMRIILLLFAEVDRAADADLLKAMVESCAMTNARGEFVLNEASFTRALTGDVKLWNSDWEDRPSTYYFDVFGSAVGQRKDILKEDDIEGRLSGNSKDLTLDNKLNLSRVDYSDFGISKRFKDVITDAMKCLPSLSHDRGEETPNELPATIENSVSESRDLGRKQFKERREDIECSNQKEDSKKPWTFSQTNITGFIDFIVDAQWSRLYLNLAWAFFVMTAIVYSVIVTSLNVDAVQCRPPSFGCTIAGTIIAWLTTAIFLW